MSPEAAKKTRVMQTSADAVPGDAPDPIDAYAATLSQSLQGPARAKARMVEELRGGLEDAAAAYAESGVPHERAVELAVHDFGAPRDVAAAFQHELTIAQTRHTARAAVLAVPLAVGCALLVWGAGHHPAWELPRMSQLLTVHLAGAAAAAASVLAVVTLAVTGRLARTLPTPRQLPRTVAWMGTAASIAMALAAFVLAILSVVVAGWPLAVAAGALAATAHAVLASSARACRRCTRVPS
ncbi:permease prefix domain 1-containing protein [Streptomyces sp. NBC_01408]|uniref:permease prefix domain 1-containing protein n=1 Tax=Streptomyces sp. NBC_01408 TaxID=2903855 RepID=UPI002254661B|nr:permease prefix domain 1-containing protein [Streptomyces sp. NBC_01408]MCX4696162.1 permease prefix domain 1-containing protein [Streptomyces sp. NBC_01408]